MQSGSRTDISELTASSPRSLSEKAARAGIYFRSDPWVNELVGKVEKVLADVVDSSGPVMRDIGRHMIFGHAKRLRPIFVLLGQSLIKDEILPGTIECAAAAELVHCASLFHDDVIDEALTRKGKTSANVIWGNKSAVVIGDYFLVLAYTLLAKQHDFRIIELFVGMCRSLAEGIMKEIENTGDIDVTEEMHLETIRRKTAAFFSTAAVVGGHIARADPEQEKHLAEFGMNFGLAFQLSDDLLDFFSDPKDTGKPRGSDIRSGIYTIPLIRALAENNDFASRFKPLILSGDLTDTQVQGISEALRSNGAMEYVRGLVRMHADKASEHLDRLPPGRARDAFRNLLHKIASREY